MISWLHYLKFIVQDFICNVRGTSVKINTLVHFHSLVNLSHVNRSIIKEAADQSFALM